MNHNFQEIILQATGVDARIISKTSSRCGALMARSCAMVCAVADSDNQGADTQVLRKLNDRPHNDERVSISLVPIGDGLTLTGKR